MHTFGNKVRFFFCSSFSNIYLREKDEYLFFFLFHTVFLLDITSASLPVILSGAPPFSHTHFLGVAYTDKLQSWEFKLESIKLVFCLTSPFCDQHGSRMREGVSSIFPIHSQPATCFLWVGRTLVFLFPLIYFAIPFNFLFLVATLFLCSYKQAVTRSP